MTRSELAKYIDHTVLKADADSEALRKLCAEAREYSFASVCVNPVRVREAKALLEGSGVAVCTVVGFPLGQNTVKVKGFEALEAIENGASEIDYVLNVAKVKDGDWDYIRHEMAALTAICHSYDAHVKVIFENCYLTKDEIAKCAAIAKEVRPDFIKTSTGFGTGGAVVEDVKLMKDTVGGEVKVKAAGGIRDLDTALAMIGAGAERLGCSAGIKLIEALEE